MAFRQVIAVSLALALAGGTTPLLVAQQQGAISGTATDEVDSPFSDYSVRLRHPDTGQILGTQILNEQGDFSFTGLALNQYIVELIDTTGDGEIVCTEGPLEVDADSLSYTLSIDCGVTRLPLLLLVGAAGLVTAAGVLNASESGTQP